MCTHQQHASPNGRLGTGVCDKQIPAASIKQSTRPYTYTAEASIASRSSVCRIIYSRDFLSCINWRMRKAKDLRKSENGRVQGGELAGEWGAH